MLFSKIYAFYRSTKQHSESVSSFEGDSVAHWVMSGMVTGEVMGWQALLYTRMWKWPLDCSTDTTPLTQLSHFRRSM